jgi:predicted SnoaL-like aldol condensation-catalyzing enzyme
VIELAAWIETYRKAWEEADDRTVVDLFTDDATYRSSIFEEPHRGKEGIGAYWREVTSTQRDARVRMGRPIADGARVAVEWWTTMENGGEEITLPGCLLLEFDDEGRCKSLHEHWEWAEGRRDPPPEWG